MKKDIFENTKTIEAIIHKQMGIISVPHHLWQDIKQAVWLAIYINKDRLDLERPDYEIYGYIKKIVKSEIYRQLNVHTKIIKHPKAFVTNDDISTITEGRHTKGEIKQAVDFFAQTEEHKLDSLLVEDMRRLIDILSQDLTNKELYIIEQLYLGDGKKDYAQVAETLGVSKQTISASVKRSFLKMQKRYKSYRRLTSEARIDVNSFIS